MLGLFQGRIPGWASLLLVLLVVFGSPAALSQITPVGNGATAGQKDDVQPFGFWSLEADPDYVFIGNSMLNSRIDGERIQQLVDGQKASIIVDFSGYVAVWYLRLKNDVVNVSPRPKTAFIFFRDTGLTDTPKTNSLPYLKIIMDGDEHVFDTIWSDYSDQTTADTANRFVDQIYQIRLHPIDLNGVVQHVSASVLLPELMTVSVRRGLSLFGLGSSDDEVYTANLNEYYELKRLTNGVFNIDNFRPMFSSEHVDAPEFVEVVDTSFLPLIIELGRSANIRLVFVRVQRQNGPNGKLPGSAHLDRYLEDLDGYLKTFGVGFIDVTGDPDMKSEWYSTGDHIAEEFKLQYTDFFFEKAISEFRR